MSIPANSRITFVSGNLADVANPDAPKGSIEAYGDTNTQVISIIKKVEKLLRSRISTNKAARQVSNSRQSPPPLKSKATPQRYSVPICKVSHSPTVSSAKWCRTWP